MNPLKQFLALAAALLLPLSDVQAAVRVVTVNPGAGAGMGGAAAGGAATPGLNMPLSLAPGTALAPALPTTPAVSGPRVLGVTPQIPADVSVAQARYPQLAAQSSVVNAKVEAESRGFTNAPSAVNPSRGASEIDKVQGNSQTAGRAPAATPQELGSKPGGQVAVKGAGADSANKLSQAMASLGPNAGNAALRQTIGSAFDGSGALLEQDLVAVDSPLGTAEIFGAVAGSLKIPSEEADRLARLADETAAWRGIRATQGEAALTPQQAAILRGIDDLARAVAIGRTNPGVLQVSADIVENMDETKLEAFSELAMKFMDTDIQGRSTPFARVGNVEHVRQQLIDPLNEDGKHLAAGFKNNPRQTNEQFVAMIRALQMATDTGKQENPSDLKAALAYFNPTGPNSYINNYILPHEYASMIWLEDLGRRAGFSKSEILAFQRLIANHNFGPDLSAPENYYMRDHWWPKNFREQMLPMMQAMGIEVEAFFNKDETGQLQYNHAKGHRYSMILSAYDRAIAVAANGNGVATWKKYGTQDFNGKKGRLKGIREANAKAAPGQLLKPDPEGAVGEDGKAGPVFEFDGPALVAAMEATAAWAEQHVESLWTSIYAALPEGSPLKKQYPDANKFRTFPPYRQHRMSITHLQNVLMTARQSNPKENFVTDNPPKDGTAYFNTTQGALAGHYRVTLRRTGPGAFDPKSTDYAYEAVLEKRIGSSWVTPPGVRFGNEPGKIAVSGNDPVALYTDLVRAAKGW